MLSPVLAPLFIHDIVVERLAAVEQARTKGSEGLIIDLGVRRLSGRALIRIGVWLMSADPAPDPSPSPPPIASVRS